MMMPFESPIYTGGRPPSGFHSPPAAHAVVPMKQLATAKGRLAGALDALERRVLALAMFERVVRTLLACRVPQDSADHARPAVCEPQPLLAEVWVVSPDLAVLELAATLGGRPLLDTAGNLNGALELARTAARAAGAGALLVVHGDLPLISPLDVAAMVGALADGADLVLAPDRVDEGTNALGITIGAPFSFGFEGRSFARHLAAAAWHELMVDIVRSPNLALDIDTPEGLRHYRQLQVRSEAQRW